MTDTHVVKLYGVICAILRTKNARHSQHLTNENVSWRLNVERSGQISNAPSFGSIYKLRKQKITILYLKGLIFEMYS